MSEALNICLVSMEWPPSSGGIGTYAYLLAKGLAEAGHTVTVISHADDPKPLPGVSLIPVPIRSFTRGFLGSLLKWKMEPFDSWARDATAALDRASFQTPFDIVEVPEYGAWGRHLVGREVKLVTRCHTSTRIVWAINNFSWKSYMLPPWVFFQDRKEWSQAKNSDAVTCPSYSLAHHVGLQWAIDRARISVIPNPVDVNLFQPSPPDRVESAQRRIVYVGRLQLGKGIFDFAIAVQGLLQRYPDIVVRIIGRDTPAPGEYKEQGATVREAIENTLPHAYKERFQFIGELGLEEVIEEYRSAYCVVMPTRGYESFSYTCAEAMSCGCAVVATRCGGPQEIIDDGVDGLLVNPGRPDELEAAISRLLSDRPFRDDIRAAARSKIETHFSTARVVQAMVAFYRSVRDGKARASS